MIFSVYFEVNIQRYEIYIYMQKHRSKKLNSKQKAQSNGREENVE